MEGVATQLVYVRPVKAEDLNAVHNLEETCFKDPFPSYFIAQLADANPGTFLVALENQRIVGYAVVDNWTDHQHLVSIAVHPDCRRRGIGQALLNRLLEGSREGPLRLELRRSNRTALSFYLKNGFSRTGIAHGYYTGGEDAIQMEKIIENKVEVLAQT